MKMSSPGPIRITRVCIITIHFDMRKVESCIIAMDMKTRGVFSSVIAIHFDGRKVNSP